MSSRDALADPSVVARADALMQRRRTAEDVPVLTEAIIEDENDLPVLTAIEPESATPSLPVSVSTLDPAQLDALARELTKHVQHKLANELPSMVEAALQNTLAGLTRDLKSGLGDIAEEAILDFLRERKKRR